jgi:hypothetical protein
VSPAGVGGLAGLGQQDQALGPGLHTGRHSSSRYLESHP